jgi:WD40 repeat protein
LFISSRTNVHNSREVEKKRNGIGTVRKKARKYATLRGPAGAIEGVAATPDGRRGATTNENKTIRLYDLESGQEIRHLTGHGGKVDSVAFSPDGRRLLSCGEDAAIRLWDVETGRELCRLEWFESNRAKVRSAVFSSDGRRALSGGYDTVLRLWGLPK